MFKLNNKYGYMSVQCNGWCTPTQIYLGLAIFSVTMSFITLNRHDQEKNNGDNLSLYVYGHVITVFVWTILLFWLCRIHYYKMAWFVLLFPYVIVLFMFSLVGVSTIVNIFHKEILD